MAVAALVVAAPLIGLLVHRQLEPRLDASSPAALRASVQRVKATLSAAECERLDRAVMAIAFDAAGRSLESIDTIELMTGVVDEDQITDVIQDSIDGMTADDVFARAAAIRLRRGLSP